MLLDLNENAKLIRIADKIETWQIFRSVSFLFQEGHRSVRKLWLLYYSFIGLKCNYYAIYLCFDKYIYYKC